MLRLSIILALSIIATIVLTPKGLSPSGEGLFLVEIESSRTAIIRGERGGDGEWRATTTKSLYGGDVTPSSGLLLVVRGYISQVGRRPYIYLKRQNILDTLLVAPTRGSRLATVAGEKIERLGLSARADGLVRAMVVGDRRGCEDLELYRRSGASHILAVSGLHVGVVAAILMVLLSPLSLLFRGYILRRGLAVAGVWLYAVVNSLSPSVERAAIMVSIMLLAPLLGRRYSTLGALVVTVGLMVLIDPLLLYDVGFQLSVVAVLAISLWVIPLWRVRPRGLRNIVSTVVVLPLLVGLCCSVATMPIVAHTFGHIPLSGVVLNPLLLITAQVIISLSVVWLLLGFGLLAPIVAPLVELSVGVQSWAVELVAPYGSNGGDIRLEIWGVVVIYLLYGVATWALHTLTKGKR